MLGGFDEIELENLTRDTYKAMGQNFRFERMSKGIEKSLLMEKVTRDDSMNIEFLAIPIFDQILQWTEHCLSENLGIDEQAPVPAELPRITIFYYNFNSEAIRMSSALTLVKKRRDAQLRTELEARQRDQSCF